MANKVTFDYSKTAEYISEGEITAMKRIAEDAKKLLLSREGEGNDFLGWIDLPVDYDKEEFARIQKAAANKDGLTGVPTGYHKLDDITSGWQPSDLVIIAGRPAMGKTSFALSMAKNIVADYRVPTAFFSLVLRSLGHSLNHLESLYLAQRAWKRA